MSANSEGIEQKTRHQTEHVHTTTSGTTSAYTRSDIPPNKSPQNPKYPKDMRRPAPLTTESATLLSQKAEGSHLSNKATTIEKSTLPQADPERPRRLRIQEWSQPRQSTFRLYPDRICDEKIIRHDHSIATHYESDSSSGGNGGAAASTSTKKSGLRAWGFGRGRSASASSSRNAIHHRDLAGLGLLSNLTRVQYGYWHGSPACLVGFKFQFMKADSSWARFEKADIAIRFSTSLMLGNVEMGQESNAVLVGVAAEDPEVVDFGPKHVASGGGTDKIRDCQLSASLPIAPISLMPGIQAGLPRSSGKHSTSLPSHVDATSLPSHGHTTCDTVRFWIREDAKQKDGLLLDFDCAVVVTYDAPASFEAVVDVKAGPVFAMLAQPWGDAEPIVFQHGEELGEPVRGGSVGVVDFADLTVSDWAEIVGAEGLVAAESGTRPRRTPAMTKLSELLCK